MTQRPEHQHRFLDQWINREEHAEVALLSAPFTYPPVPSIALSIFQSTLSGAGISSRIIYASYPMIHLMGAETIPRIGRYMDFHKDAEYLFAHLTDVSACVPVDEFIRTVVHREMTEEQKKSLADLLRQGIRAAEETVEATARRIIHMGARVVAASSIYSQQNAGGADPEKADDLPEREIPLPGGGRTFRSSVQPRELKPRVLT